MNSNLKEGQSIISVLNNVNYETINSIKWVNMIKHIAIILKLFIYFKINDINNMPGVYY